MSGIIVVAAWQWRQFRGYGIAPRWVGVFADRTIGLTWRHGRSTRRPCRPFNEGSRSAQLYLHPVPTTQSFMSDSLQLRCGKRLVIPVGMQIQALPRYSARMFWLRSLCDKEADLVFDAAATRLMDPRLVLA